MSRPYRQPRYDRVWLDTSRCYECAATLPPGSYALRSGRGLCHECYHRLPTLGLVSPPVPHPPPTREESDQYERAWERECLQWRQNREFARKHRPDPYWSLWGKLKSRHERDVEEDEWVEEMSRDEPFEEVFRTGRPEYERPTLRLPVRRHRIEYDGEAIEIEGRRKPVRGDHHAVNFLRKLDTDDKYYAEFMKG